MKTKTLPLLLALGIIATAPAATLRVEQSGGAEFTTVNAAIFAANPGDTIRIGAGLYDETIIIDKDLTLIGTGPQHVKIRAAISERYPSPPAVFVGNPDSPSVLTATLDGLTLSSVYDSGVYIMGFGNLTMLNCVVADCREYGIYHSAPADRFYSYPPVVRIRNSTIANNNNWGIHIYCRRNGWLYLDDCIITGNKPGSDAQIWVGPNDGGNHLAVSLGRCARDARPGFITGQYYYYSSDLPQELGNPRFVDAANGNYMILPTSIAKDKGTPGIGAQEIDGTRSDMGAYSGPTAARFWPYPIGGPVVRDISVNPGIIVQGGSLTLKATATTR